jgi:DNA-binding transcriptional ArsR family regulator
MTPRASRMTGGEDDVFAALADPTRWQLLNVLVSRGEGSASALAAELPVSRPAVVKHLNVLSRAGLVRWRRQGREVRYSVRPERLDATARWLSRIASEWDDRLAALKRLAES